MGTRSFINGWGRRGNGAVRKWRRARTLTAADYLRVAYSALWLLAVRVGLRLLPFLRLRALLKLRRPATTRPFDQRAVEDWSRAVDVAARHQWPLRPARCLARSLVLERALCRRGWPAVMHIGVRREGGAPSVKGLDAHAWVECAGQVVGDRADVAERFAPLQPGTTAVVLKDAAELTLADGGWQG